MAATSAFSQDFTFVVIPDPQNFSDNNPAGVYNSQTQWISDNKTISNIVFATCVGDMVNYSNSTAEYGVADAAFDILDNGGVQYSVSPGNHDEGGYWGNYFGISRFSGKSWFQGYYTDYQTYSFFSASGNDFIVINLDFNPITDVIGWADALLKAYPERRGIVVQHDILNVDNSWNNQASYTALKDNPNLFLMLCGHMHTASDGAAYRAEPGDDGHIIHIVQADYQEFTSPTNTGYLRILRFSPENDMIYMTTYSPFTGGSLTSTTNYDKADLAYDMNMPDYRSVQTGSWASATTWEYYTGSVWSTPSYGPASDGNTITINSGHTVTVGTSVSVEKITIEAGGAVTVSDGVTLTNSGTASDFVIKSSATNMNGSLILNGTGAVSGIVTYERFMPGSLYRYISSPLSSSLLPEGIFWKYDETLGSWGDPLTSGGLENGKGYTMLANGGPVYFTGSVVAATESVPLTVRATAPYNSYTDHYTDQRTPIGGVWGGGGWNLLGNPFTSAMDAGAFIDYNNGTVDGSEEDNSFDPSYQAVYIYNGTNYYYIAAGVSGYEGLGTFPTYTDIQAGQGFFVLANYNNVPFRFTSAMQIHNTVVPMTKSAVAEENPWPGLQLRVKFGEKESSTLIVFNENMTAGLDPGYDVGQLSAVPEVEIYTSLVEKDNSVNFAQQALPMTDLNKNIVPVGIDSEKGGEVTFSAFTVPLGNNKFWLEDRKTGIFTNLNLKSYTVTLPAKTYGTGRFYIIASANIPTGINDPEDGSGLRIWATGGRIIIRGTVSGRARCEVFDVNGRKITDKLLNDGDLNIVELSSPSKEVLIVRVTDGAKVTTRKVTLL